MSYVDLLVAAYRSSLAADDDMPLEMLRAELISAVDAEQRGRLLGLIARSITLSLSKQGSYVVPNGVLQIPPDQRRAGVRQGGAIAHNPG